MTKQRLKALALFMLGDATGARAYCSFNGCGLTMHNLDAALFWASGMVLCSLSAIMFGDILIAAHYPEHGGR